MFILLLILVIIKKKIKYVMILGECGPIFSDTLFTQTAHNRNIDICLSDLTHIRGTFF